MVENAAKAVRGREKDVVLAIAGVVPERGLGRCGAFVLSDRRKFKSRP